MAELMEEQRVESPRVRAYREHCDRIVEEAQREVARTATERSYRDVAARKCDERVWAGIIDRAIQDALKGDHRARQFLATVLMGRGPLPPVPSSVAQLDWDSIIASTDSPSIVNGQPDAR